MLVLSRKLGQSFHLGPDVRVTIVKIDRNSVRIGIEAPGEVPIQREEIVFELPEPYAAKTRPLDRAWKSADRAARKCRAWTDRARFRMLASSGAAVAGTRPCAVRH